MVCTLPAVVLMTLVVLCLVVALVERFGSCSLTRPNMGTAQCFLGQPWGDQWAEHNLTRGHWTAFFSTPEFIYFHRWPRCWGWCWRVVTLVCCSVC